MSYELADSERAGIAALCHDLKAQGCRRDTIEHIRGILTARCCALNSMAAQLRQREADADVYRGMFEREAAAHRQTESALAAQPAPEVLASQRAGDWRDEHSWGPPAPDSATEDGDTEPVSATPRVERLNTLGVVDRHNTLRTHTTAPDTAHTLAMHFDRVTPADAPHRVVRLCYEEVTP